MDRENETTGPCVHTLQYEVNRLKKTNAALMAALKLAHTHIAFVNECVHTMNWPAMALAEGTEKAILKAIDDAEKGE